MHSLQMASLTRLVRSVSGRNIVNATIIEHPDTIKTNEEAAAKAEKLEKVKESTPAEGEGEPTKKKEEGGKKNKGKNKKGDLPNNEMSQA